MNLASFVAFFLRLNNRVASLRNPNFETKLYVNHDYFNVPYVYDNSLERLNSLNRPCNWNILQRYPRASVIAVLGISLAALTALTLITHGAILPFMPVIIKGLATALGAPMISATACHSIGLGFGLFCAVGSVAWATRGIVNQGSVKNLMK